MNYTRLVRAIDSASQQLQARAVAAVNQSLVLRNWIVGAYLVEFEQRGSDRAKYGARLMERLAKSLAQRGLKGLGASSLKNCRQFYLLYPQIRQPLVGEFKRLSLPDSIRQPVVGELPTHAAPSPVAGTTRQLPNPTIQSPVVTEFKGIKPLSAQVVLRFSWTHILELIRLDDPFKRAFYENECLKGNWSKRQLQRQIGSLLCERTALSKNKAAVVRRAQRQERRETIEDLIRDPYVLEFTGLAERPEYLESDLEKALLDHLQAFLLELGTGFCFEARQKRITVGNKHDYIDLVFYQRRLRCHVLLDLKIRGFEHGDAGQIHPVRYPTNYEPVLLRLRSSEPQRRSVLHRLYRRPKGAILRARSWACRFNEKTQTARPRLLRGVPASTRCNSPREISQDRLGEALFEEPSGPLSNGVNFYLNWWKEHGMEAGDNPPVGIILCGDRDRTEVEFATAGIANRLFVSRYLTGLPSAEQLREFLEKDRDRLETLMPETKKKTRRPGGKKK